VLNSIILYSVVFAIPKTKKKITVITIPIPAATS
jgi:hypothetical protein